MDSGADTARAIMKGAVEEGRLRCVDVDAGHWIMLEKPEETKELLRRFFEGEADGKSHGERKGEVGSRL